MTVEELNAARKRKQDLRNELRTKEPELYELATELSRCHRAIRSANRSVKKLENFLKQKLGFEL